MFTNIGRSGQQHDEFVPSCLVHTKKDWHESRKSHKIHCEFVDYRFQPDRKTIYPSFIVEICTFLFIAGGAICSTRGYPYDCTPIDLQPRFIKSSQVLIETVLFIEQKPLLLARIHDSAQGQIGEAPLRKNV